MRKKAKFLIVLFIVLICVLSEVFATWEVGNFVDEFDDPTGEHFLYSITWGTFSNSVTKKSDSPMRLMVYVLDEKFPSGAVELQVRSDDWMIDDEFYDDSTAIIKVKDEEGNVYSYYTENSEDNHGWNILIGRDAISIINLLKDNETLKIYIKIESYTYNYTLDCSDFVSMYEDYIPEISWEKYEWDVSSIDDDGYVKASIVLDEVFEESYCLEFVARGYMLSSDNPIALHFNLYYEDEESKLYWFTDCTLEKVSFSVGNYNYSCSIKDYIYSYFGLWHDEIDWNSLYDVLNSGEDLVIDVYTTEYGVFSFTTSASDFLKYIKYPYDFLTTENL